MDNKKLDISKLDFSGIWTEKYRPAVLNDLVLDSKSLAVLRNIKEEIPNLLFTGAPGTGKTTTAKIIVNDILKCNYLYINASDESGIDTIRYKITNFAQTKSFDGKVKVIILDEADGLTSQAQQALRNTMESFAKYCRFILTANYKHKIIPALQSRCQSLELKPVIENAVKRCYNILQNEGVAVKDEQKKKFVQLVKTYFPDLRKTINELQKSVVDNELCIDTCSADNELLEAIFKKLKNTIELRSFLIENEDRFQGDYDTLLTSFLNFIYVQSLSDDKKKEMIAIIADHLWKSSMVLDKEINCFACMINLERVL